ncbi:MAG: Zn-dependent alcohol dehydrogenase [Fimbriimonadaceae bacterium]|nr:Zn-dependent alcohol dehydrogenase [Fimbriimonadaceae bacterium]
MKIRAAVLEAPHQPFQVQEADLSEPREGEVLIKVAAVGVCHSDWHLVEGATNHPFPLVAGHEGAGTVVALGGGGSPNTGEAAPNAKLAIGDLVALNWAANCGSCFYCLNGRPSLCDTYVDAIWAGTMIDGTTRLSRNGEPIYHYSALACFAEYCVVPVSCCVKMPSALNPEIAAVIGCAVTTGVGSVLNTAQMKPESSVVVIGAGGVGLSTIMGAKVAGASKIIAIDPLQSRRDAALQMGAHLALDSGADVVQQVRTATDGRGADYVFEAVGKPVLQELALELARPGGVIVYSGLSPSGSATNIPGAVLVRQEKTVMGSYYGTCHAERDFPLYAEMFETGRLPLGDLVSHRYSLDQINEAYADMLSGKSVRGVIVF